MPGWIRSRPILVEAVLVVGGFTAVAALATYPLVRHISSHLPSDLGDPVLNAWILGWDASRLRHGLAGVWDAPNFFPYRHTLAFSENLFGIAIFTAPIQWLTGNAVLTYNVAFIGSWVLSGAGMYVLARALTGRVDAALIAAAIYAFTPLRAGQLSHLQWLVLGWLPLSLWAQHRYFATADWWLAVVSAAFFLLQATSSSYCLYYGLVPVACIGLVELWGSKIPRARVAIHALVALLLLAAVVVPIARAYYFVRTQYGLRRSLDAVIEYSADVRDFFLVSPDLRAWPWLPTGTDEHSLFPGVVPTALALLGVAFARRRAGVVSGYVAAGLLALVLALGPAPAAWGHVFTFAAPYRLALAVVPGLDGVRAPARLMFIVVLALGVLGAFGAAWAIDRVPRLARPPLVAALIIAICCEGWLAPLRLRAFDAYGSPADRAGYDYLRQLPRGGAIELPMIMNAEHEARAQYMTLLHWHPVVNGHSGYLAPLAVFLGSGHSPFAEYDHEDAALSMSGAVGIRYLIVHRNEPGGGELAAALLHAATQQFGQTMTHDFGDMLVITVPAETLSARPRPVQRIPTAAIRATASNEPGRLPLAFDGDPDSRWLSAVPQTGNEWIELGLDRPRDVAFVRMRLRERSFGDYPRRLAIEVSEPRVVRTVYDGPVLSQLVEGILAGPEYPAIDIVLPPNHSRSIRLRQTGTTHAFFWSIHELELWERPDQDTDRSGGALR